MKITNKHNQVLYNKFTDLIDSIQFTIDKEQDDKKKKQMFFKQRFFKLAKSIIKKHPTKIKSSQDLKEYSGIGKGIKARVDEVIETGDLKEINTQVLNKININKDAITNLTGVHGIGRKMALEFVKKYNVKNISELKKKIKKGEIEVGDKILVALKHHDKFETNIPRKEIDTVNNMLKKIIPKIDKKLIFQIAGSYRRGASFSNDIDILLSHKDNKENKGYIQKVVKELKKKKIIIGDLTDNTNSKYMGFSQLKNKPVRRLDIVYTKYDSYGAALLYFTGSYQLNTIMRNKAKKNNMRLNQYGLYNKSNNEWILIPTSTEKEIFNLLDMKYLEPKNRNT